MATKQLRISTRDLEVLEQLAHRGAIGFRLARISCKLAAWTRMAGPKAFSPTA